jgi:hypothetical protein
MKIRHLTLINIRGPTLRHVILTTKLQTVTLAHDNINKYTVMHCNFQLASLGKQLCDREKEMSWLHYHETQMANFNADMFYEFRTELPCLCSLQSKDYQLLSPTTEAATYFISTTNRSN